MLAATWVGIGILIVINIVGWIRTNHWHSRDEAKHLGKINGSITGLSDRVGSLETQVSDLSKRIDTLLLNYPGNVTQDD